MIDPGKTPARSEVPAQDRWDLSGLFTDRASWEAGLAQLKGMGSKIAPFAAAMTSSGASPQTSGEVSAETFLGTLSLFSEYGLLDERLGNYAHLRVTEDEGDAVSRGDFDRYIAVAAQGQAAWAWFVPAVQTLPGEFVASCLADARFADYRIFLDKLLRFKPHVLSEPEERLLALQTESNRTAQETFGILTNVDFDFGLIDTPEGAKPLTQSTFSSFMRNPDRDLRKRAYDRFYETYGKHMNTITSLYSGSVKLDRYQAQVRRYGSAREMALFPDDVPAAVYDNLVSTVNANLPALHEYYDLRAAVLGLDELRHYDVYVPLVPPAKTRHSYAEAVDLVSEALAPLGADYVATLRKGLLGGWVDRYENKGKRSGAFSSGGYAGDPYILLNYKEDVLHDVFTMAHEGGHSMHSWFSARNNPFLCYSYTIFEAEVASTFNEELVFKYLYEHADDESEKASLLADRLDNVLATLYRQTMFAEYEMRTHAMLESGEPLTVDSLRVEYRKLLVKYFGPKMRFEELSDIEGLRIPHFYNAFYVYKYSTGISASIALADRVMAGGEKERAEYFAFLKSGGSRFPIEALKVAGVDMSTPAPVQAACSRFAADVRELKRLLSF